LKGLFFTLWYKKKVMKTSKTWITALLLFCLSTIAYPKSPKIWGELEAGPYSVGFRLIRVEDSSRSYPNVDGHAESPRPIRIYLWYPSETISQKQLLVEDFVRLAAEDFGLLGEKEEMPPTSPPLPVQLVQGMSGDNLTDFLSLPTASKPEAPPAKKNFPLIVLGQGLYYESPLTHLILCEYLASHGYVVTTCPLMGTRYRLVNLNVEDLETQVRDMETALGVARKQEFVHPDRLGVIGYDLGGMAGLILSMRNPDVDAFLSLDAGILYGHYSQLPNSHPSYREDRFRIPWMHITQARFVRTAEELEVTSLMDRKRAADSYLLLADTSNHGNFTSYALFGIENSVPGYWGPVEIDSDRLHIDIIMYALDFFEAYLENENEALERLAISPVDLGRKRIHSAQKKHKNVTSPSEETLIHLIIEKGMDKALAILLEAKNSQLDAPLLDETVLNWLGYHFLYWWGRRTEAVEVFKLTVEIYPESANAFDSLGEAYAVNGDIEQAIRSYRKSLQLNPDNSNAKAALERLEKK
jgi:tetratricopeptide (TPR) repeat protein